MIAYQFQAGSLSADGHSWATLTLPTSDGVSVLRVRLCPSDAQTLATAMAGLTSGATRLAQLVRRLAERLDAVPRQILLRRTSGNVIEASLLLAAGLEPVELPLTFGDAMLLAQVNRLPIAGEPSLAPLVQVVQAEAPESPPLPPAFAAFFETLE